MDKTIIWNDDSVPSEEEVKRIIDLWNDNKSYGDIARELNGPKSTIQGWIKSLLSEGKIEPRTDAVRTNTKNATAAKVTYDLARRQALNDKLFAKIEEAIEADDLSPGDLKNFCISFGILEDKRQIIEPPKGANGAAAIDIFIEDLKREASEDEQKAER